MRSPAEREEPRQISPHRGISPSPGPLTTSEMRDTRMIEEATIGTGATVLADETEDERVIRWRLEQLAKAGYSWACAMVIAASRDIDLHRAVDLAQRGCPIDTAMRILL